MTDTRRRVSDKAVEKLSGFVSKLHHGPAPATSSSAKEDVAVEERQRARKRDTLKRKLQWPPESWLASSPSPTPIPRNPSSSRLSAPSTPAPAPLFEDEPPHLRQLMVSDEDRPLTLADAAPLSSQHDMVDEPEEMIPAVIVDEPEELSEEPTELTDEPEEFSEEPTEFTDEPEELHLDIPSSSSHHFLPTPSSLTPGSQASPALVASPGGMEEGEEPPTPPATRSTTAQTSIDESYPFPKPPRHPLSRKEGSEVKETYGARASTHADGTRMLNQYVLLDTLGRGSFGLVQAAIDAETGEEYAIKELSRARLKRKAQREAHRRAREIREGIASSEGRAPDPNPEDVGHEQTATQIDALYLIRNEIAIMKKVNHPNVVRLFEVLDAPSEDTLYMVLELCRGGTIMSVSLDPAKPSKPLPMDEAHDFFRQMVSGVSYLHANDIVHHDIKPDNVLLTADRKTVKLVDFGVSAVFEKPGDDSFRDGSAAAGVASPAFAAPEQFGSDQAPSGRKVHGMAADIWSLGVTLMCMVTGRLPFEEESMIAMYEAITTKDPVIPSGLPHDLVDLVKKMLTRNPDHRIKMAQLREHPWITERGTRPLPAISHNAVSVSPVTQADLDDALLVGLHSLRQAFHDAVAAARKASREHAATKGDRLGDGKRRAFFYSLKEEIVSRGAVSKAEFERSWLEWRSGSKPNSSTDLSPFRLKREKSKT